MSGKIRTFFDEILLEFSGLNILKCYSQSLMTNGRRVLQKIRISFSVLTNVIRFLHKLKVIARHKESEINYLKIIFLNFHITPSEHVQ